jgi:hypothetical protein
MKQQIVEAIPSTRYKVVWGENPFPYKAPEIGQPWLLVIINGD